MSVSGVARFSHGRTPAEYVRAKVVPGDGPVRGAFDIQHALGGHRSATGSPLRNQRGMDMQKLSEAALPARCVNGPINRMVFHALTLATLSLAVNSFASRGL